MGSYQQCPPPTCAWLPNPGLCSTSKQVHTSCPCPYTLAQLSPAPSQLMQHQHQNLSHHTLYVRPVPLTLPARPRMSPPLPLSPLQLPLTQLQHAFKLNHPLPGSRQLGVQLPCSFVRPADEIENIEKVQQCDQASGYHTPNRRSQSTASSCTHSISGHCRWSLPLFMPLQPPTLNPTPHFPSPSPPLQPHLYFCAPLVPQHP